jgi:hypothetical protein
VRVGVQEDAKLREVMKVMEGKSWSDIAPHLPGRTGKQCRERCVACARACLRVDVVIESAVCACVIDPHAQVAQPPRAQREEGRVDARGG